MLRSARTAAIAALACLLGLALTGLAAFFFPIAHVRDSAALQGFTAFDRPRLSPVLDYVAHLADPVPYAIAGTVMVLVALGRRRPRTALAVPVILVGAELTTQGLKLLLAQPRIADWLGTDQIASASWPSGHATAAMAVALCAVLAGPPRARPVIAALGGLFAIAVAYAILALRWHFPSDVVGGYLVALTWTLATVAVVQWSLERFPGRAAKRAGAPARPRAAPGAIERRLPLAVGGAVALAAVVAVGVQPERSGDFAEAHPTFVVGAAGIAALAAAISIGFARAVGERG